MICMLFDGQVPIFRGSSSSYDQNIEDRPISRDNNGTTSQTPRLFEETTVVPLSSVGPDFEQRQWDLLPYSVFSEGSKILAKIEKFTHSSLRKLEVEQFLVSWAFHRTPEEA